MSPQELTAARESLGLSKTELAGQLGITRQTVANYEAERQEMPKWLPLAMTGLRVGMGPEKYYVNRAIDLERTIGDIQAMCATVLLAIPTDDAGADQEAG